MELINYKNISPKSIIYVKIYNNNPAIGIFRGDKYMTEEEQINKAKQKKLVA